MSESCNIKDCEKYADKVYCPNRFDFLEMCNIRLALYLVPEYIENFMNFVKKENNYDSLNDDEKQLFDKGDKIMKDMDKLCDKVDNLIKMAELDLNKFSCK